MNDRTLRVAAIQMESANGDVAGNLARAGRWTEAAARRGAELILLPELFSTGFQLDAPAWQHAEPQGGATETWLTDTARRHGLHIGGSYLEARGEDFFNTFALAAPDGRVAGRVRKSNPCSLEAYLFKAGHDPHVIDTAIGRIAVAICYEGTLRAVWDEILAGDPDLLLMPMSAPTPMRNLLYTERRIAAFHAAFRDAATAAGSRHGIPAVLVNKWGPWSTTLPAFWPSQTSHYPGLSHIADSDGREVARMADAEGFIVATVHLVRARKQLGVEPERDRYKPWALPVPWDFKLFPWFKSLDRRWYGKHPERACLARRISGMNSR